MHLVKFIEGIDEITVPGLSQWDLGRTLLIELPEIPSQVEVHFAQYRLAQKAPVVDATIEDGVITAPIPNIILQTASDVVAWVCSVDGETRKTIKTICLPVEARAKPDDYIYTETEVKRWEDITKVLETWEEDAKNRVVEEAIRSVDKTFTAEVESLKQADAETKEQVDKLSEDYNEKVAELEETDRANAEVLESLSNKMPELEQQCNGALDIAADALTTSNEAKEIAEGISGIATESLTVANRAFENSEEALEKAKEETARATNAEKNLADTKQDNLTFDGIYSKDTNPVATVETVIRKVAEIVANAPEDFNTLKELSDWLNTHSGDAAEMNSAIHENAEAIKQNADDITEVREDLAENYAKTFDEFTEKILTDESLAVKYTAGARVYAYEDYQVKFASTDIIPIDKLHCYTATITTDYWQNGEIETEITSLGDMVVSEETFGYVVGYRIYIVNDYQALNEHFGTSAFSSTGLYISDFYGSSQNEIVESIDRVPYNKIEAQYLNIPKAAKDNYGLVKSTVYATTVGFKPCPISNGTVYYEDFSNTASGQVYGYCSTAEATTTKTVSNYNYKLVNGGIVAVKFTNAVPANSTLKFGNNTAKPIYYRSAPITNNVIKAGDIATFMYNSSQYLLLSIDRWHEDIVALTARIEALENK